MNSSLESTPSLSASALENCTGDRGGGGACAHGEYGLLACRMAGQSLSPSRLLVDEVVLLTGRQVEAESVAEVIDQSRRLL